MTPSVVILYFLVLGNANGVTTIPEPYENKQACEEAAKAWYDVSYGRYYTCIPWQERK
jgi:hypothetical protein